MSKETAPPADTPKTPQQQRDPMGRWAPGNFGGPGNPYARKVAKIKNILLEEFDEVRCRMVCQGLIDRAIAGNLDATKLLFQYVIGKPAATVDPDRLDIEQRNIIEESTVPLESMLTMSTSVPADLANVLQNSVWPFHIEAALSAGGIVPPNERSTVPPPQTETKTKTAKPETARDAQSVMATLMGAALAVWLFVAMWFAGSNARELTELAGRTATDVVHVWHETPLDEMAANGADSPLGNGVLRLEASEVTRPLML